MLIEVGWVDLDENVMAFNFRGKWTAESFYLAVDEFRELVEQKPHSVQVIIDFSYSITPPPNLMTLLRVALKKFPTNIENLIVIGKSNFWHRVFLMLNDAELVPVPFKFVYNADEAYELLEAYLG